MSDKKHEKKERAPVRPVVPRARRPDDPVRADLRRRHPAGEVRLRPAHPGLRVPGVLRPGVRAAAVTSSWAGGRRCPCGSSRASTPTASGPPSSAVGRADSGQPVLLHHRRGRQAHPGRAVHRLPGSRSVGLGRHHRGRGGRWHRLTISFYWNDPNNDGKFRLFEFGARRGQQPDLPVQRRGRALAVHQGLRQDRVQPVLGLRLHPGQHQAARLHPQARLHTAAAQARRHARRCLYVFAGKFGTAGPRGTLRGTPRTRPRPGRQAGPGVHRRPG